VGDVLMQQGDLHGALHEYRRSLAIAERLAAADPTNSTWQRGLAVSHYQLAALRYRSGNYAEKEAHLRQCFLVLACMSQSGMFLDEPLRRLYLQLEARFRIK